jgi:transglutaminase-like putative cysteine protease
VSDVVTAPRPEGPSYLGLYLRGHKVGYVMSELTVLPDGHVRAVNEQHFKARVEKEISERHVREVKVYEASPGGRLVSMLVEQRGDGGDQTMEGTSTPTGLRLVRKRPGLPNEVLSTRASSEVVEDADQVRVALKRNARVEGTITDGRDLSQYHVVSAPMGPEVRLVRGEKVPTWRVVTSSEREKESTEAWVDAQGRLVELHFGAMVARLESEAEARRVEAVEVFGLTRITLPRPMPPRARALPGAVTLTLSQLPQRFRADSPRQRFTETADGHVAVALSAAAPTQHLPLPVKDPAGGKNLASTLDIESTHADIRAQARRIVGTQSDSLVTARLISTWVHTHMTADYGASSERATDVLRTLKGDCTEHALLTTALLRASGIPARRVYGLVYLLQEDQVPALYWHEWVEAWVGEWTQLDPTLGQDVADATHLELGEEAGADITPLLGSIHVLDVR